ncbi:MAG: GatB/YqeY domain-containing protein [Kofleriaceae bacterium]
MAATLEQTLREELTAAIKAKDLQTANLIRMINTKISERRTAKGFVGTVDDALILDVISTYKKQMEKARADYANAGERGKAQLEELEFEVRWCGTYLPAQLSEDELRAAIAEVIKGLPQRDPKQAGRVIGAIKKLHGDRADAQLVKRIADELLATS